MTLKAEEVRGMIDRLLAEVEEEDVSISLFTTFYQNEGELDFFSAPDRERVLTILRRLSDDSKRHKGILEKIITGLGEKHAEK